MKKQIVSAICSAIIVPGLGQILNHHIKKGLALFAIIFILLIAGTVKLFFIINSLLEGQAIDRLDSMIIMERLHNENLSPLWILLIIFGIVWLYSIVDAFLGGGMKSNRDLN